MEPPKISVNAAPGSYSTTSTAYAAEDERANSNAALTFVEARTALAQHKPGYAEFLVYSLLGIKPHRFSTLAEYALPAFGQLETAERWECFALLLEATRHTGRHSAAIATGRWLLGLPAAARLTAENWAEALAADDNQDRVRTVAAVLAKLAQAGTPALVGVDSSALILGVVRPDEIDGWFAEPHENLTTRADCDCLAAYLAGQRTEHPSLATENLRNWLVGSLRPDQPLPPGAIEVVHCLARYYAARGDRHGTQSIIEHISSHAKHGRLTKSLRSRGATAETAVDLALIQMANTPMPSRRKRVAFADKLAAVLKEIPPTATNHRERLLDQLIDWDKNDLHLPMGTRATWPKALLTLEQFPSDALPERPSESLVQPRRNSYEAPLEPTGFAILAAGAFGEAQHTQDPVKTGDSHLPWPVGAITYDELIDPSFQFKPNAERLHHGDVMAGGAASIYTGDDKCEMTPATIPTITRGLKAALPVEDESRISALMSRFGTDPNRPIVLLGFRPTVDRLILYAIEYKPGRSLRWYVRPVANGVQSIRSAIETFDESIQAAWNAVRTHQGDVASRNLLLSGLLLGGLEAHLKTLDRLLTSAVSEVLNVIGDRPDILLCPGGMAQALPLDLLTVLPGGRGTCRPLIHYANTLRWLPGLGLQERLNVAAEQCLPAYSETLPSWAAYLPQHHQNGRFGGFFRTQKPTTDPSPGTRHLYHLMKNGVIGPGWYEQLVTTELLTSLAAGKNRNLLLLAHGCWDRGAVVLWDELLDSLGPSPQLNSLLLVSCTMGRMGWASPDAEISHSLLAGILRHGTIGHLLAFRHTIPDVHAVDFALQASAKSRAGIDLC